MATKLKKLRLTELSLVDNPANADAVVTLTKRYDDGDDNITGTVASEMVPARLNKRRKMFDDVKATQSLWQLTDSLSQSLRSILDDEDEEKRADIEATVDQFKDAVASLVKKGVVEKADDDEDEEDDDEDEDLPDGDDDEEEEDASDDEDEDEDEEDPDLDDEAAADEDEEEDSSDDDDSDAQHVGEDDNASTTSEDGMTKSMSGQPQNEEEILKSLPESVRKRIEEAEKVAKEASEAIAKLNEEKAQADAVALAKSYLGKASGDASLLGGLLRKASDEEKAEIQRLLKAHNTALTTAHVFASVGDAGSESDELSMLNKRAEEIRKANPKLTSEQAVAVALEENPDAYAASI